MIYFSDFSEVSGGWTPAQLFLSAEAGAWYDVSDLSTLWQDTAGTTPVTADGQHVARVDDKSGNGNHLLQATSSSRPTLSTDSAGKRFLSFSTTFNNNLTTAAFAAPFAQPNYFCIGFGLNSIPSGNATIFDGIVSTARNDFDKPGSGSTAYDMFAGTQRNFGTVNTNTHIATLVYDGASSIARIDAVAQTLGGSVGTQSITGLRIGNNFLGTGPAPLRFYAMVVRDTSFMASLTDLETWMAGKTAVSI